MPATGRFAFIFSSALIFFMWSALAGPPPIQWQKDFGGDGEDNLLSVACTSDGGAILAGYSRSGLSGTKTSTNFGAEGDGWIIKVSALGNEMWQRTYGGTSNDVFYSIHQNSTGGCLVAGSSRSPVSGNKTSPGYGWQDYWLLNLDTNGDKVMETSAGGSISDWALDMQESGDGGYIVCGGSSGGGGNKTAPYFSFFDYWIVKFDSNGNKIWDKAYGGHGDDQAHAMFMTSDGGCIVGGTSGSVANGNKTSVYYGVSDFWIVKLNSNGGKEWEKSYGGTGADNLAAMMKTADGGYILAGSSDSPVSGTKTNALYGNYDFWIIKIDANGNELWQKSFGGTADDELFSIAATIDGGYVLGGQSRSGISGTKTSTNYGAADFWVVRLDAGGAVLWDNSYGGYNDEYIYSIQTTSDGGYIFGGFTASDISGNKTVPHYGGYADMWVIKLQTDVGPTIRNTSISGGNISFSWTSGVSEFYAVQAKTNLTDAGWTQVGIIYASGTTASYTGPATAERRFYRVVLFN